MSRQGKGFRSSCRDRLVVRTLRCGRSNPGSNPGHGSCKKLFRQGPYIFLILFYFSTIKLLPGVDMVNCAISRIFTIL